MQFFNFKIMTNGLLKLKGLSIKAPKKMPAVNFCRHHKSTRDYLVNNKFFKFIPFGIVNFYEVNTFTLTL